ncbi:MAG TPA: hypothetical protein VJT81_06750 [Burkholderiales bacterium]|nr:hypothetical protein [Burkholderiales bacterium]
MPEQVESLSVVLPREIARARELLKSYQAIGPAGAFGQLFIAGAIKRAEQAQASNDTVGRLRAYIELKGLE